MEVMGALASSLQIVSQCVQVTITMAKWIESVKTVDDRIGSFINEVKALQATYEGLNQSLREPSMLEAARNTNRDAGGHLWAQLSQTLHDCEKTMVAITNVLRRIQDASGLFRPVVKQLKEELTSGELARLREQVVLFNSSLQLPMQMISLTMQLKQQEMTTVHQLHLNEQLFSLRRSIQKIEQASRGLVAPKRQASLGGSTLMGESTADKAWFDNMEHYVETAKKFLDSASIAASTLSAPSVACQEEEGTTRTDLRRRGSNFIPLTTQKLDSISRYVDQVHTESTTDTPLASDAQSTAAPSHDALYDSDDDDVDLQLLQKLLSNGHAALDGGDFAAAEDNYREALTISQSNDFGPRMACSTADVCLMLGECLVKHNKYDEAIVLLQPLASQASPRLDAPQPSSASMLSSGPRTPDKGQALSANHLLGEVYLKKSDYVHAESHAVQAFKGRKKLLGEAHHKTRESVELVIEMYKAKGQSARGEAYKIFLKPIQPATEPRPVGLSPASPFTPSPPAAEPVGMPTESSTQRPRRTTFDLTSRFRTNSREERTEPPPLSVPYSRSGWTPRQSIPNAKTRSHYLEILNDASVMVADKSAHLSTSPNETASLHGPMQTRKESMNSDGWTPYINISRKDTDEVTDIQGRHRSSLSRAPTSCTRMSRLEMEGKFEYIAQKCKDEKSSKDGIQFLQLYDPHSAILILRTPDLKANMKKGTIKGLAGTGHGYSPLHFFCDLRFEPVTEVEILLQLGVDVNAVAYKAGYGKMAPFTPLTIAVDRGHYNIIRMLLEKGGTWRPEARAAYKYDADRRVLHPLLVACSKGYAQIVQVLLEHGMQLVEEDFPGQAWHGNSLLHEACFRCDIDVVDLLMNYARRHNVLGGNNYSFIGRPGQQDNFGVTPIMYAADMRDTHDEKLRDHKSRNRVACLKLLLENNNNIRTRETENGEVVVDHAESNSWNRWAMDLHIQDKRGKTVYWYANEDAELKAFLDGKMERSRLIDF